MRKLSRRLHAAFLGYWHYHMLAKTSVKTLQVRHRQSGTQKPSSYVTNQKILLYVFERTHFILSLEVWGFFLVFGTEDPGFQVNRHNSATKCPLETNDLANESP